MFSRTTRLLQRPGVLAALGFVLVSATLMTVNGSVIFEYDFLERFGDQRLYHGLALAMVNLDFPKSPYTIGYPLLYVIAILLTGQQPDWASVMPVIIPLQAFVIVPATMWLVFKDKTRRYAVVSALLLVGYYLIMATTSHDRLAEYNLLGLMPLSEPLAMLYLVVSYHVYLVLIRKRAARTSHLVLLAACIAAGLLTRNVLAILYLPIFVDLLMEGMVRQLALVVACVGFFYLPQIAYNYLASGDVLFNGYTWWASENAEKDRAYIGSLYGINSNAMFSMGYLTQNITTLLGRYLPLLTLSVITLSKPNRFTVLVASATLVNLSFYLLYWWSAAGGLIDRFLMPNVILLLYLLQNQLTPLRDAPLPGVVRTEEADTGGYRA